MWSHFIYLNNPTYFIWQTTWVNCTLSWSPFSFHALHACALHIQQRQILQAWNLCQRFNFIQPFYYLLGNGGPYVTSNLRFSKLEICARDSFSFSPFCYLLGNWGGPYFTAPKVWSELVLEIQFHWLSLNVKQPIIDGGRTSALDEYLTIYFEGCPHGRVREFILKIRFLWRK
jgi:hypothetical protein